jgi:hypothetical protein
LNFVSIFVNQFYLLMSKFLPPFCHFLSMNC